MKVAIVVGEASGDILASGLIVEFKKHYPDAEFIGVTGPLMREQGCHSLSDYEPLAIMGIVEILRHIPKLIKFRRDLVKDILAFKPDVFIGVDAPDFNLGLERMLKEQGVLTVHYVSPSVWAWRQGRMKKIRQSVDHMLTLLPFEAAFYEKANLPVTFVGHPMADAIPLETDRDAARKMLGLPAEATVVAMLPGSRGGEIHHLAPPFFRTAKVLNQRYPNIQFIVPVARAKLKPALQSLVDEHPDLNIILVDERARDCIIASNAVLVASGTATLETMLCGRPMVVAYKVNALTFWLLNVTNMVNTPAFSLPNLLTSERTVEEFIQHEIDPVKMAHTLYELLTNEQKVRKIVALYREVHVMLRKQADVQAAKTIAERVTSEAS